MTDYSLTIVDYPGSSFTQLQGINNAGEVVGVAVTGGTPQGFSEIGGTFTKVDYPVANARSVPYGVNDNGDIVGLVVGDIGATGYLDKGGVFTNIKVPGASGTAPDDISNNGEIVGYYSVVGQATEATHAFVLNGGALSTFDVPNSVTTSAHGVNDAGVIVGEYAGADHQVHGFADVAGAFTTIDVPNSTLTIAEDINNKGDIAGYYTLADGIQRGFVLSNGMYSTVGITGVDTQLTGINDAGQAAGFAGSNGTGSTPASYDGFIANPVCFATGTAIRTTCGDCAVENLVVGDEAVTATGDTRPIVWIGHREMDCRGRFDLFPVCVAAHAFGADLPERDLTLSPGHPVLVGADEDGEGGHLVPIMCLVNGTTVRRVAVETVIYWHVELDAHDILLAENLPAESYLDWGDRGFFSEGSAHALTNPDFVVPGLTGRCRLVALDGPVVEAERRRLDALFAISLHAQCIWPATGEVAFGF